MLPGLISSPRPVSACEVCGSAQNAPATRGKNRNSSDGERRREQQAAAGSSGAARLRHAACRRVR